MIFDTNLMSADDLAYGGTPTVIDLGNTTPGKGRGCKIFMQGHSLVAATGLTLTDGATDTAADGYMAITASAAELNAGMEISMTSHCRRYLKVSIAGTASGGTWTCGVILDQGDTNP